MFLQSLWVFFYINQDKRGKKAEREGRRKEGQEDEKGEKGKEKKERKEFCNNHINSLKGKLSESGKVFQQKYKCRLTKIGH